MYSAEKRSRFSEQHVWNFHAASVEISNIMAVFAQQFHGLINDDLLAADFTVFVVQEVNPHNCDSLLFQTSASLFQTSISGLSIS